MMAAISYHSLALGPIIRGLKNTHAVVQKGVAHVESKGDDPNDYLNARLAPDMLNFVQQIQRLTDSAKGIPPRVNPDTAALTLPDEEKTFPELLDRINRTVEYLEGVDEKSFEGREGAEVVMKFAQGTLQVRYSTLEYVQMFGQPNFWFHVVTAYDILRMKGVPLGKFDFINGSGIKVLEKVETTEQ